MLKIVAALLCIAPQLAFAGGVERAVPAPEVTLWSSYRNSSMTTGGGLGGHKLPTTAGFRVDAITWFCTTAAGTATGTMTLRVTDGTNNCDAVVDCTTTDVRATGTKRIATTGACAFAPGAALSASIQAQCLTAQPSVTGLDVVGFWNQ